MEGVDVNILKKADRSTTVMPHGQVHNKVERYKWTTGGPIGSFAWIKKNDLNIDGRYQRDQVSEAKVRDIASNWDWLLVGTISVIRREDGSFWVFDGGHRTRAAFWRHDIDKLPCMVHEIGSVNDEAKAFVARNTMTSNVSAFDRFHASVYAKEPVAATAAGILEEFGVSAVKGGSKTAKSLSCVGALQKCVEANPDDAKKVFSFCLKLAGDESITANLLSAMFCLHQHFKKNFDIIDVHGEKISRHSQRELTIKMNQFATECGRSGAVIGAKALLEVVNHRSRNRLFWE